MKEKCECGNPVASPLLKGGVIRITDPYNNETVYLNDGPGVQKRLDGKCAYCAYYAGLTPAIRHPGTGKWVPGKIVRACGRDGGGHVFYAWVDLPLGMSLQEAANLQYGECEVDSSFRLLPGDLFPHTDPTK